MIFHDFQSFLRHLEEQGELKRVKAQVDPEYEITEIYHRVISDEGPAMLFENVKGSLFPMALNFFGSMRRVEIALGRHPEEIGANWSALAEALQPPTLSAFFSQKKRLWGLRHMRLVRGRQRPCQELIEKPDLRTLPALKVWPKDGGRFITFPLVFTHDPKNGGRNVGLYRMHIHNPTQTGMHWQIEKGGGFHYHAAEKANQSLPVAVALGADPALMLAAACPLPEGVDEWIFSGLLRQSPGQTAPATQVPVQVPAHAEFVLEGYIPAGIRHPEGPFGDHFGHYSLQRPFPVFEIKTMTRKRNPVYPAAVVGKPPQEDKYMGDAIQMMFHPIVRLMHPEIRDLWAYFEAGFHNLLVVSVEQRYAKEAMKTALSLMGEGQLSLTKFIVLVDPGVDVRSWPEVLRAVAAHFDPAEDFLLLPGVPLDTLDFTSFTPDLGSKMVMDATSGGKAPSTEVPKPDLDPTRLVPGIQAWKLLEQSLLVVQVKGEGRPVVEKLVAAPGLRGLRWVVAVSPDVDLDDQTSTLWGIFTRFDCARDVVFAANEFRGAWPVWRGCMGIDATWKKGYPEPVEMLPEIAGRVEKRWAEYQL
ncbi:MAG: menaquinone biosynthesis decarboxylase [Candidatus Omnitrophica bacterium]|nr:menaquinone biosynthesis decarboxylase [Candidatus Omnitrophota bacterium]